MPENGWRLAILLISLAATPGSLMQAQGPEEPAFEVSDGLFDPDLTDTLGLEPIPGTETVTVFRGTETVGQYNHGAVLIPFRGKLYAQWQNSARDEDSPDTRVLYAASQDGSNWTAARPLLSKLEDAHSSGGWWTDGKTLVAYIVRWKRPDEGVRSGVTEFITSIDGDNWTRLEPVRDQNGGPVDGVIEQDPHRLPGDRIVSAFHEQPGLVLAPWYTDDPLGVSGWTRGRMPNLPHDGDSSREIEPSWFLRGDGTVVMIMRDQASTFRKLASTSNDRGVTWSKPAVTAMPDSRSKQSAGNLPDGTAFMVGNPTASGRRFPLAIVLSADGFSFDRAFLLRGGDQLPAMRYPGRHKRAGFSYPKSVVWNGWLHVAYATNKEDIEISRVPLDRLTPGRSTITDD
jgi:hypothetical protein